MVVGSVMLALPATIHIHESEIIPAVGNHLFFAIIAIIVEYA